MYLTHFILLLGDGQEVQDQDIKDSVSTNVLFLSRFNRNTTTRDIEELMRPLGPTTAITFNEMTGVKHHTTIPYSKEENGIVELANKEVNRHIRNILFDKGHSRIGPECCA
jgi:hypothetical protein